MRIFNVELLLKNKDHEPAIIEDYKGYLKKKLVQLLIIATIYFILFYSLSFFSKELDKLGNITPSVLKEDK